MSSAAVGRRTDWCRLNKTVTRLVGLPHGPGGLGHVEGHGDDLREGFAVDGRGHSLSDSGGRTGPQDLTGPRVVGSYQTELVSSERPHTTVPPTQLLTPRDLQEVTTAHRQLVDDTTRGSIKIPEQSLRLLGTRAPRVHDPLCLSYLFTWDITQPTVHK